MEIAQAFVKHYYSLFDSNQRQQLASLYSDSSMLTFEGQQFQGKNAIIEKLMNLGFNQVQHGITTLDVQPSPGNGLLIFISGNLAVDGETDKPLKFSQVFNLLNQGGAYFVMNDLFRLNYG